MAPYITGRQTPTPTSTKAGGHFFLPAASLESRPVLHFNLALELRQPKLPMFDFRRKQLLGKHNFAKRSNRTGHAVPIVCVAINRGSMS